MPLTRVRGFRDRVFLILWIIWEERSSFTTNILELFTKLVFIYQSPVICYDFPVLMSIWCWFTYTEYIIRWLAIACHRSIYCVEQCTKIQWTLPARRELQLIDRNCAASFVRIITCGELALNVPTRWGFLDIWCIHRSRLAREVIEASPLVGARDSIVCCVGIKHTTTTTSIYLWRSRRLSQASSFHRKGFRISHSIIFHNEETSTP